MWIYRPTDWGKRNGTPFKLRERLQRATNDHKWLIHHFRPTQSVRPPATQICHYFGYFHARSTQMWLGCIWNSHHHLKPSLKYWNPLNSTGHKKCPMDSNKNKNCAQIYISLNHFPCLVNRSPFLSDLFFIFSAFLFDQCNEIMWCWFC